MEETGRRVRKEATRKRPRREMKRCSIDGSGTGAGNPPVSPLEEKIKRPRSAGGEEEPAVAELGEDLILEVLKRADGDTVGRAACVCRLWRRLAMDERLWEVVCTRDWVKVPCGEQRLRALVLTLGGFRRLHSLHILPLLKPYRRRLPTASPALAHPSATTTTRPQNRWGKDEVQLSLALLSLGFFEKMNPKSNRSGGGHG